MKVLVCESQRNSEMTEATSDVLTDALRVYLTKMRAEGKLLPWDWTDETKWSGPCEFTFSREGIDDAILKEFPELYNCKLSRYKLYGRAPSLWCDVMTDYVVPTEQEMVDALQKGDEAFEAFIAQHSYQYVVGCLYDKYPGRIIDLYNSMHAVEFLHEDRMQPQLRRAYEWVCAHATTKSLKPLEKYRAANALLLQSKCNTTCWKDFEPYIERHSVEGLEASEEFETFLTIS